MFVIIHFCITFVAFLKLKILFYYLIIKEMKKLVLLLAVVFSASLFSCGNAEKAEAAADTVALEDTTVAPEPDTTNCCGVDSCACDTCKCDSVKCK